ncbi:MAG: hypothetical protein K2O86_03955, partial [Clostridia bacterium]|nr:hypothetical protein [Clostridia bacterium]
FGNIINDGHYNPKKGEGGQGGYGGLSAPAGAPSYTIGGDKKTGNDGQNGSKGDAGTAGISTSA